MSNHNAFEPPIDFDLGVQVCGNDEAMFINMLGKFEELSFTKNMEGLFQAMMTMDLKGIEYFAHEIKGPSR